VTPLRLRVLIGLAVVALLAVFAIVGGDETPESLPSASPDEVTGDTTIQTPAPANGGGRQEAPVLEGSGVSVEAARPVVEGGYPHTEQGAIQAAVALLEATEEVVSMSPTDAAQTQRLVSTAASADRLAEEVEAQIISLQTQAPQGIEIWIAPIEARSTAVGDGYDISIWYTQVVAIGTDAAVDNWTTVTYSMRWEDNSWKMDSSVSVPGPTPARRGNQTPTTASALVGILIGFSDEGLTS